MPSELIRPSRCTADLPEDLEQEHFVSELKLDGSRYVLYLGPAADPYGRQKLNALLSRRESKTDGKFVDKTANIPHITDEHYKGLDLTVLDGETFLKDFATSQGVMGSSPKVAIEKQAEEKITYWVFDIMAYRGKDVRGRPLAERRKLLEAVVATMGNDHVKAIPQWKSGHAAIFQKVVSRGGEGTIIKDVRAGYGVGWAKMKKAYDVSCFISGYKPGKGKYEGGVGAIAISVYDDSGNEIEVGFASGFSDEIREELGSDPEKWKYKVVDIYAHELSKPSKDHPNGRLRHPTFLRFREDLEDSDCTLTKLKEDLAKDVKSKRWRGE